jgi:hypothetical protein
VPASKTIKASVSFSKIHRQSLADCAQKFSLSARKLGTEYLVNSNVEKISCREDEVVGTVRGDHPHKVVWKNLGSTWQNHCSCSLGANCEHSYAIAHYVLQYGTDERSSHVARGGDDLSNDRIDRLLSLVSHSNKGSEHHHHHHRQSSNHKSIVTKILESRNSWDALQHIPALLSQLGIKADPEAKHWAVFVESENPKKRAWLLARELLKFGEKLPPELETYRHCENFEKEERKEKEENLLESVQDWVQTLPYHLQKVDRTIRVVWFLKN